MDILGFLLEAGWEGVGFEQSEETEWGDVGVAAWLPVICVQLNEQVIGTCCPPEAGAGGRCPQHGVVAMGTDSRAV